MQENKHNLLKMSFKDYYNALDKLQAEMRSEIVQELDISIKTFYNKLNSDKWSPIERAAIEKIIEKHVAQFQQKQISHV